MNGFIVKQPGLLTLIQDRGRFGAHNLGLTNGGPLDALAFDWANRLLGNAGNASALEISFGGLLLESEIDTAIVVTGAEMPIKINDESVRQWQTHSVKKGDAIDLGYATNGTRTYLSVAGGFNIPPSFGSSATVVREKIGGLSGDKLQAGDHLPCEPQVLSQHYLLADDDQPQYADNAVLRMVLGYQQNAFERIEQARFFGSEYQVTDRSDRMGFRLEGEAIKSNIVGMLSEGICHGAIQIPADGQPIVLMNDRQTIGGYPKIGSVIPLDTAKLAQLNPGSTIKFEPVSPEYAHNLHYLAKSRFERSQPVKC
jgi:biotin-dependent carboxylase-like uncharacterized protein